ncbi:MAG: alpha-glucan family phosphorylase, partial [Lentisphaeria bacterium]|nr:alpha-glucan family phosphorylase [Lentisphaeria bacterium]
LFSLYDRYLPANWATNPDSAALAEAVHAIPDDELWMVHELSRQSLVRRARKLLKGNYRYVGNPAAQKQNVLDPDVLTIGFARRFATYKRGTLLLRNAERLIALLKDSARPIQFIFAGKAHPADDGGKRLIQELIHFAEREGVLDRLLFLENYDIGMARSLVQGVDVWLNTPRRPQEASGTSGMKAAVNGVVNCSILDGWWAEGYNGRNGWAIEGNDYYTEDEDRDNYESQALFNLLENEIIPCFYERQGHDLPLRWINYMKESIITGLGEFSSTRMVDDYENMFYRPAREAYQELTHDNAAYARRLRDEKQRLEANFYAGRLHVTSPVADRPLTDLHVGDTFRVTSQVYLGDLTPAEVEVEAYFGTVNAHNEILESSSAKLEMVKELGDGNYEYSGNVTCTFAGRFGLTARIKASGTDWDNSIPGFVCWPK